MRNRIISIAIASLLVLAMTGCKKAAEEAPAVVEEQVEQATEEVATVEEKEAEPEEVTADPEKEEEQAPAVKEEAAADAPDSELAQDEVADTEKEEKAEVKTEEKVEEKADVKTEENAEANTEEKKDSEATDTAQQNQEGFVPVDLTGLTEDDSVADADASEDVEYHTGDTHVIGGVTYTWYEGYGWCSSYEEYERLYYHDHSSECPHTGAVYSESTDPFGNLWGGYDCPLCGQYVNKAILHNANEDTYEEPTPEDEKNHEMEEQHQENMDYWEANGMWGNFVGPDGKVFADAPDWAKQMARDNGVSIEGE